MSWQHHTPKKRLTPRGYYFKTCPVTFGNPTSMTWGAFERVCFHNQDNEEITYCTEACLGYCLPDELTIIENPGETYMTQRKQGTCEICADKKTIQHLHGMMICTGCGMAVSLIKKNPAMVVEMFKKFNGDDKAAGFFGVEKAGSPGALVCSPDSCEHMEKAYEMLEERMELLKMLGGDMSRSLKEQVGELVHKTRELIEGIKNIRVILESPIDAGLQEICETAKRRMEERDGLHDQIDDLHKQMKAADMAVMPARSSRDSVLLDLCLGIMAENIKGIDVATIYQLRHAN